MHNLHAIDRRQVRGLATAALWRLPLIAAGVIAAYELGTGHIALAALVAGLLLAFQGRMDTATGPIEPGAIQHARGDGGTSASRAVPAPYAPRPLVLDGGSLEHRRHQV